MPLKMCSHSQAKLIRLCERRWFMHYGMKARINSRDRLLREIAFLKKLKPSFMWRGELVHDTIARVLKSRGRFSESQAMQWLENIARQQWSESERRALSFDPKTSFKPEGPILTEHYYPKLDQGLDLDSILELSKNQLSNFFSWENEQCLFDQLKRADEVWIEPPVFLPNSPGFMVDNIRFVTKVDLAFQSGDTFRIYDWKTSTEPAGEFPLTSEHRQASFYALWPHLEKQHPLGNVDIEVVYIGGERPRAHNVSLLPDRVEELLADAELIVRSSAEFLTGDSNFELEDFDWASSVYVCKWCPFQQICQKELS